MSGLRHSSLAAALRAATSLFLLCMRDDPTFPASGSIANSIHRFGTICQDRPNRSSSQPHGLSAPPSAMRASRSRSVSAGFAVETEIEPASSGTRCGPPFRACQGVPARMNSTARTEPGSTMSRPSGLEAGPYGVRGISVCPGGVDGPRPERQLRERAEQERTDDQSVCVALAAGLPRGGPASPKGMAGAMVCPMSDAAGNITGKDLPVDGGTIV